jgi:hypothetical protein
MAREDILELVEATRKWVKEQEELRAKAARLRKAAQTTNKLYPPRKREWTPGECQVGLFIRDPSGNVLEWRNQDADPTTVRLAYELLKALMMKEGG